MDSQLIRTIGNAGKVFVRVINVFFLLLVIYLQFN